MMIKKLICRIFGHEFRPHFSLSTIMIPVSEFNCKRCKTNYWNKYPVCNSWDKLEEHKLGMLDTREYRISQRGHRSRKDC